MRAFAIKLVSSVVVSVPMAITFFDTVGYVAKVEGSSMQPVLNPNSSHADGTDYVLLKRWGIKNYDIQRGDVVSVTSPREPGQKLIKRVIGLEGDTIHSLSYKQRTVRIPDGHCWLEGDHSQASMDSNFFGPIAIGLIHAKAAYIVWPPERWQKMQSFIPKGRQPVKQVKANTTSDLTVLVQVEDLEDELFIKPSHGR